MAKLAQIRGWVGNSQEREMAPISFGKWVPGISELILLPIPESNVWENAPTIPYFCGGLNAPP